MSSSGEFYVSWYKDDDFEFMVEPVENFVFLHIRINKWSKSVAKRGKEIFKEIEQEMTKLGYKCLLMYNPEQTLVWDKLVTKFAKYPVIFTLPNGHHIYGKDLSCQHCQQ